MVAGRAPSHVVGRGPPHGPPRRPGRPTPPPTAPRPPASARCSTVSTTASPEDLAGGTARLLLDGTPSAHERWDLSRLAPLSVAGRGLRKFPVKARRTPRPPGSFSAPPWNRRLSVPRLVLLLLAVMFGAVRRPPHRPCPIPWRCTTPRRTPRPSNGSTGRRPRWRSGCCAVPALPDDADDAAPAHPRADEPKGTRTGPDRCPLGLPGRRRPCLAVPVYGLRSESTFGCARPSMPPTRTCSWSRAKRSLQARHSSVATRGGSAAFRRLRDGLAQETPLPTTLPVPAYRSGKPTSGSGWRSASWPRLRRARTGAPARQRPPPLFRQFLVDPP